MFFLDALKYRYLEYQFLRNNYGGGMEKVSTSRSLSFATGKTQFRFLTTSSSSFGTNNLCRLGQPQTKPETKAFGGTVEGFSVHSASFSFRLK